MSYLRLLAMALLCLGTVPFSGAPTVARAQTITVTSTSGGTGGPDCTLRDAIAAANSDTAVGGCAAGSGADVIELTPGATYTLSAVDNGDSLGPNGLPVITSTMTINGHGAVLARAALAGTPDFRFFHVVAGGALSLSQLTLANGRVSGPSLLDGGAALVRAGGSLAAAGSVFSGNYASASGGAIASTGALSITGGAFTGNRAFAYGGAVLGGALAITGSSFVGNNVGAGQGGAVAATGRATIGASTFATNTATSGGGLFVDGLSGAGEASVVNSTFTANGIAGLGGGLSSSGALTLTNVTVAGNASGVARAGGTLTLRNTILTSNGGADCSGALDDGGGNIHWPSDVGGCPGVAADPKLGPLADNGGPTQTMALPVGSGAIDAGADAVCPPTDQRGVARPQGAACDSGAYEAQVWRVYLPFLMKCGPQLAVTPAAQPLDPNGTRFNVSGACFRPNESLTRWYTDPSADRTDLAAISADPAGSFGRTLVLAGCWPVGTYTYFARGNTSGQTVSVQFAISRGPTLLWLEVSPASQSLNTSGMTFAFGGCGFTPNGPLARWFIRPDASRQDLAAISADGNGYFARALSFTGNQLLGTYTYYAQDNATGRLTSIQFSITAAAARADTPASSASPAPFEAAIGSNAASGLHSPGGYSER
jgi:predicted outer membrane repeat protein